MPFFMSVMQVFSGILAGLLLENNKKRAYMQAFFFSSCSVFDVFHWFLAIKPPFFVYFFKKTGIHPDLWPVFCLNA